MELFHIHTYRCGHAENISDEAYVIKAIEAGADSITFTDHAPFTCNPFCGRMQHTDLSEYFASISNLKGKYQERIKIRCGLEIEYLPSYAEYYKELAECRQLDLLLLGQHFYEIEPGKYSFMYPEQNAWEYQGCMEAIAEGINTGLFYAVAHPDRSFRRIKTWTSDCDTISKYVITAAEKMGVYLEQNFSSQNHFKHYWKEFWKLVSPGNKVMLGIDAHSISDVENFIQKKAGGRI